MFLLSGVFFPLNGSNLPDIVPTIAWFMPLTHAVNVIRRRRSDSTPGASPET